MNNFSSFILGSVTTIVLTTILDLIKDRFRAKMELRKLVFQRKTNAAEKAMSWLQESVDCYRMLQTACREFDNNFNIIVWNRFMVSSIQAGNLYERSVVSLNPIYLYYDFSDIENKHNIQKSLDHINHSLNELGKLDQQISDLQKKGLTNDSLEIKHLQNEAIKILNSLPEAFDTQIKIIGEIMNKLRQDYKKT